jgi:hypothetical protein
MLAGSLEDEGESQAQRLERMRSEFVVARQRRERAREATPRPGDTDDGPLLAGPSDERLTGIAAERP